MTALRMKLTTLAFLLAVSIFCVSQPAQALTMGNLDNWANRAIGGLGESNTATYGQTFTLGEESSLDSFSFYVQNYNITADVVDFKAYIADWNGSNIDNIFWSSDAYSTDNVSTSEFDLFTIDINGLNLDAGNYVLFLSTSELFDGLSAQAVLGIVDDSFNQLPGGLFYMNNGDDFDSLFSDNWAPYYNYYDLAYELNYSQGPTPTPEPSTFILLGLSLLGVIGLGRKKLMN
ncbi:PEP-CTERM sorting domain-containing protein [Pseudodesulfovibrio thermohalotolerans]|uniref:PEP-CTERM sorting domain-containing protein n=1 Tax=Pseudodesulfovibrio thermohalotolerans TaxID=2880651 RepID=UPI002442C62A|nr:PEP-CTERM sorting domain-containing protein [Pseudodesulfovibrio thermohalotolerans]WFS62114.1 PEP-CTERM sorting domain-containing protein [Pseudodesulfovibrio thermohalotolerans]